MIDEPLFREFPQLSMDTLLSARSDADPVRKHPQAKLKRSVSLHDQLKVGYGDHDLIPDDEGSVSRVVQLHSADKDYYAYRYADIVSTAMAGKFELWWIELFAGPGRLFVEPRAAYAAGSPVRALGVRRPFDGYVFNDLDPQCVAALSSRVGGHSGVHVSGLDANSAELFDYVTSIVPRGALVTVYGDP
ncbi:MAG: hypothetical protein WKF96_02865, partial [Solirubrobacteraceae bacterium]